MKLGLLLSQLSGKYGEVFEWVIKISSAKSINFPWVFLEKISSMFNQQTNALL